MSRLDALVRKAAKKTIPLDVSLELTHHCNYRCRHCYIPDFAVPDALTTRKVLSLFEELVDMGTLYLTFTGGEILLRRDWYDIVKRARKLGFVVRLLSNGSRIDRHVADLIASVDATVEVTVFTMNSQVFDEITRTPGAFDMTMRGIEHLHHRTIDLTLKVPIMTLNVDSWQGVETHAESLGVEFQSSATILARKNGDPGPIALRVPPVDLPHHFKAIAASCQRVPEFREDEPLCAAASRYCNITSSGDVMACNALPGSGGNLLEKSFKDIWQNSLWFNQVRSIRKRDLHTCCHCEKLPYCSRCHAQALVEHGDLYGPSSAAGERADALIRVTGGAFGI
jgi:radical SAM protein with 4Fe4S-binding SPASM domain